ncbi:gamma-glutamyltransferase [Halomonas sp. DN3]|uniref:gamma-glutamyltransferase n=1 Tax=Halomonas sp. DN3 TaxID=2953657 RepID=UPI0020A11BC9|nr:gamma-glutamyltransferase [Halomonas sp. DN3]USZ51639.1 gamma-glutamyltransferase [Halomonas sp. DN3]
MTSRTSPRLARLASSIVCGNLLLAGLLTTSALAQEGFEYARPDISPESSSGYQEKPGWSTASFAVAAANPLATDAGYQVIKAGGSAIDAAIAVQMVLTLVEPQSSGIGGGSFLMLFDGEEVHAFDGREKAPLGADEALFLDADGEPIEFMTAVESGRSVGVPGTLRMLELAHDEYGELPWKSLFAPAITLATEGFEISPRLHQSLASTPGLAEDEIAGAYFFDDQGEPLKAGTTLRNPALAAILTKVAEEGSSALHTGEFAEDLVSRVQNHPELPGTLSLEDMAGYAALEREPLCTPWRDWEVCGFPPPSSGHLTVMQILGMMEALPEIETAIHEGVPTVDWLHPFLEASRLAFADRGRYIGDSDFVEPPGGDWNTLLAPDYLAKRAELIKQQSMGSGEARPGNPGSLETAYASQPQQPEHGTSHISIVDPRGQAVAMTSSIEQAFGSRIMANGGGELDGGYLLNNELTDFSFTPTDEQGTPIANRVQPGKRPRSSMSPTLVFERESGELVASLGSPGGAAIIHYTAQTLDAMLTRGVDAQQALDLPHAITTGGTVYLEQGRFPEATLSDLRGLGHEVETRELTSGLQALKVTEDGFYGGADPRREGVVMGD